MVEAIGNLGDDPIPNVAVADATVWFGEIGGERFDRVRAECDRLGKTMMWVGSPTAIQTPKDFAMFARRDGTRTLNLCGGDAPDLPARADRFMRAVARLMEDDGDGGND